MSARTREAGDDRPLYPSCDRDDCQDREPLDGLSAPRRKRAAVSRTTDPRRCRQRSGSMPHDVLAADPRPHRYPPVRPALARQPCRLSRLRSLARARSANPAQQPAIGSFTPVQTPKLLAKATRSAVSAQPLQRSRRHQIPIASAAPLGAPLPRDFVPWRFSDAGLSCACMVLCLPASENLHNCRQLE